MHITTLTPEGYISIPAEVREHLAWKPGARLSFFVDDQGQLIFKPESTDLLGRLPGLLHHLAPRPAVSIEDMDQGIAELAQHEFPAED